MKHAAALLLILTACDEPTGIERPPDRYLATGTVLLTTSKALPKWCSTPRAVACAPMDGSRRVNTLDPCDHPGEAYADGLCHEIAHSLKGWPAGHPE